MRDEFEFEEPSVSDNDLRRVAALAARQAELEAEVAGLTEKLGQVSRELRKVAESDLPEALLSCGLTEFTLSNGTRVKLDEKHWASIPKDNPEPGYRWLEKNGHGDVIKHDVTIRFGRGEDDLARDTVDAIRRLPGGNRFEIIDKKSVNPQTLSAFVREQVARGANLPYEDLGVYVKRETKIKRLG